MSLPTVSKNMPKLKWNATIKVMFQLLTCRMCLDLLSCSLALSSLFSARSPLPSRRFQLV